jgi:hypothetical protein
VSTLRSLNVLDLTSSLKSPGQLCGYIRRTFKVEDIKRNPWSEICWYFPESREQYRLGGDLVLVGEDHPDEQLREVSCGSPASCRMKLLASIVVQIYELSLQRLSKVAFLGHFLLSP